MVYYKFNRRRTGGRRMTLDNVYDILMAVMPAATSVFSVIGVALAILKKFKNLTDSIADKTDQQEVIDALKEGLEEEKATVSELLDQNYKLESQIAELVDKIDKIKRS